MPEVKVNLRDTAKHPHQDELVNSSSKRLVVRAGRRGGKTVGLAKRHIKKFLQGLRVLYGAPTIEQVETYWFEVCHALAQPIEAGLYKKNESEHFIELEGTKQRIKAKTCWNANTLRGDYADELGLDEIQIMAEDTWDEVGVPMLMDNDGDAVLIYTPPSLHSSGVSKARDPRWASKLFKSAQSDKTGRWHTISFSSHENPYISAEALSEITKDMSLDSYRREILAEDEEIEQSWLVHGKWRADICRIPRFEIPKNWLIYSGHDFGRANPAALFIAQDPGTGNFYAFREYLPEGAPSPAKNVEVFKQYTEGYNVINRVGGSHQEEENRLAYTSQGWPIAEPNLNKVKAQLDRVFGLEELNRFFVFEDMICLLTELSNCLWVIDENNKPTDKIKDESKYHLLACMRYILSYFTPETVKRYEARVSYA